MKRIVRRRWLWAAAIYAALAIGFVSPALEPGNVLSASDYLWHVTPWSEARPEGVKPLGANFELADQTLQFEPFLRYTHDALTDVPLWNPHVMGGRPFHANAQSAVFSPFSAPAYVTDVQSALVWVAALKLFVAAFGAYLLGRALRLRFTAALLCGVVYAFGLFFVAWLTWPLSSVWAWLPWLLALTEVVVRRPSVLGASGLAGATALQFFGGHPESSFHILVATVLFFVLRLAVHGLLRRERRRAAMRAAGAFAGAVAAGAVLAAVLLVPLAELILHSSELSERTGAPPDKISPRFLATAVLADYWGRPTQSSLYPFVHARAFYAGALPLMLAAIAVALRPNLERIAVAGFGAGAVAVVVGAPPIHQVVNALPIFSTAHNGRMIIYYLLAVAVLAAMALDDLTGEVPAGRRRAVLALTFGLLCAPLAWLAIGRPGPDDLGPALETAWAFKDAPPDADVIRLASMIVWLSFAGGAALLVFLRVRERLRGALFAALAVAFVAADLFRVGMGLNPAIPEETARMPVTGAIEYLRERNPDRFVGATAIGTTPPLTPNTAMDFGLYDARGYDYPTERRFSKLWKRAVFAEEVYVPQIQAPVNERSMRAFNLLSARSILITREAPRLDEPGLRLAYDGPDARIYSNARALPRTFLVWDTELVDGEDEALDAVLEPQFDGRRRAVVEEPLDGLDAPGPAGTARITGYDPERVAISLRATRPALVVLTDVHFPGWKASVDGREVPIERINYLHRGVVVDAGIHEVEFEYEPASWRIGWIVSLAGLVILLVAVGVSTASRRSAGGARAQP